MASNLIAPLTAAQQPLELVGQQAALNCLRDAIYSQDRAFRLMFLRAQGGMGKTRVLEEMLKRVQGEWASLGDAAVSNIIDVIDMRLHDRGLFIRELRDQFPQPELFSEYEHALDEVTLLSATGAQLKQMQNAQQSAIDAFLKDLKDITVSRRVVWVIDTVEQLSYVTSQWLLDNGQLTDDDLRTRTHQWLIDLICNQEIENVTLVLAGRGDEGKTFFKSMHAAFDQAARESTDRKIDDIELQPLDPAEIRAYFAQLVKDREGEPDESHTNLRIQRWFDLIAREDNDRADVLWLYTGGIPVRLALYAQIIAEGHEISKPLRFSFEQAVAKAKTDNPKNPTPELEKIQWDIEDDFINVLFRNLTSLRAHVLQLLVRAQRGLSAEQIHYLLDNRDNVPIYEWQPDMKRLRELTQLLKSMDLLYLVKGRSSLANLRPIFKEENRSEDELEAATFRLGLQDEIYRIYAEHMAPHKDPVDPVIRRIWDSLNAEDRSRYQQNWGTERSARRKMYEALSTWSEFQHDRYLAMKRKYMDRDERQLELQLRPEQPRTFYFEQLGIIEVERRSAINEAIITFEIEEMVYHLLRDPENNINENYIDIGTSNIKNDQGDIDFWAQAEMWRITHDKYSLKFANFTQRDAARHYEETMVDVLHRAVEQEDVSRWIKRFVLRNEYARALELANRVENKIAKMQRRTPLEERIWYSWNHTLVHAERRIWACYACIYLSKDMPETLQELQAHIHNLETLLAKHVNEPAIEREDGHIENGFAGVGVPEDDETYRPPHPAYTRVRRLLSLAYDVLGYGQSTLGQVRKAVRHYGRSLYYIRGDKGVNSHRGFVLNDLSKALSDMGQTSIAVCLDGLNLRRELAEEVPLAASYNTLALIYDDMDRYEEAPELVAKAIAYFRRAGAERWLGLALTQLGESLRHLAIRARRGELAQATPDGLYAASEILLREARDTFLDTQEVSRLIIVNIEIGSLYRDRLRTAPHFKGGHYREALVNLNKAIELAKEHRLKHLLVDALINLAWTHFHARRFVEVNKAIADVEQVVDPVYLIQPAPTPTAPDAAAIQPDAHDENLDDFFWVMRQFSKKEMVRGQVAFSQFEMRAKEVRQPIDTDDLEGGRQVVHKDAEAQTYLQNAAKAYVLAFGYANLLSRSGRMVDFLIDDLYDRLKKFNPVELDDFHGHVIGLVEIYPKLEGISIVDRFLHNFFGIAEYQKKPTYHLEAKEA